MTCLKAARLIFCGVYAKPFWGAVIVVGHILPVLLLVLVPGAPRGISLLAGGLALIGLLVFEHIWLMAGQALPLS